MKVIKWIVFTIVFILAIVLVISYKMIFTKKGERIDETIDAVKRTRTNIKDFLNLNPPLDFL